MAAQGAHKITAEFEQELCKYTGSPYAVAVDSCSSALFLSLKYVDVKGKTLQIPKHTFPGVPCVIIHAGAKPEFIDSKAEGAYRIGDTPVMDSALRFTWNMYIPDSLMCVSFTGPHKHLKLGKGGAILTDDPKAVEWLKRARNFGRNEVSYHDDTLDRLGWNMWMLPEIAAKGIFLMWQFYDRYSNPLENEDLQIEYPDLTRHPAYLLD